MREIDILITFCILLTAVGNVHGASNICDKGCELNGYCGPLTGNCGGETPYCCHRSWWDDMCVPEGFGFRECGTGEGYCHECNEGCSILPPGEKCGTLAGECSEPTPYCCKKHVWAHKCVEQGYDFGCCGGIDPEWEFKEGALLAAEIVNTDPTCVGEYPVKWEVRKKGETEFKDYSSACWEGNYKKNKLKLNPGESITLTCRTTELPPYYDGPHMARYSWCDGKISKEGEYGFGEVRIKCWNGGEHPWSGRLSIEEDYQTDKFCKCVTGEYGVEGYLMEDIVKGWVTNRYVDPRDNEIWDTESDCCQDRAITVVFCLNNPQIAHPVDRDYYRIVSTKKPISSVKIHSPKNTQKLSKDSAITFTGKVDGGEPLFTYTWSVDGKTIKTIGSSLQEASFHYDEILSLGSHKIKLSVKDNTGETKEDEITIFVMEKPLDVSIKLGDEKGGDDEVDDDGLVWATLTLPVDPETMLPIDVKDIVSCEIDWGEGKGFESIDPKIKETNHCYTTTDVKEIKYKCRYYAEEISLSSDTIDVRNVGLAVVINSPENNEAFFKGDPIEFTGAVYGGTPDYTYTWSIDGDTKTIGPTSNIEVSFERNDISTGKYTVSLDVSDANSNRADESVIIYIPSECKEGGSSRIPCESSYETFKPTKWVHILDICDPEPPMRSTIKEWIFSDSTLSEQVLNGKYDDSVTKIFNKVWVDVYMGGLCGDVGPIPVDPCADYQSSEIIEGHICGGICVQWTSVLLSLIRTLGVPEDRVYWAGFDTSNGGHVVTVYKSDDGTWWVLDLTCCHKIVPVKNWKSTCGSACTCSYTRYAYGNDYGYELWKNRDMFDGMCKNVAREPSF